MLKGSASNNNMEATPDLGLIGQLVIKEFWLSAIWRQNTGKIEVLVLAQEQENMSRKKSKRVRKRKKSQSEGSRFRTSILKEKRKVKELKKAAEAKESKAEEEKQARAQALQKESVERDFHYRGKSKTDNEEGLSGLLKTGLVVVSSAIIFALVLTTLMREERPTDGVVKFSNKRPVAPKINKNKNSGSIDLEIPIPDNDQSLPIQRPAIKWLDDNSEARQLLLGDLVKKSAFHKSLSQYLEDYDQLRTASHNNGAYADYRERQRLEAEILDRIRALGEDGVPAIVEVLKTLTGHPFQLFLARALAGMENPQALAAAEQLLGQFEHYGVRMQLVKSLPRRPESIEVIGRTLDKIKDANLRVMVLREYAHRTRVKGQASEETVALFRKLALSDANPTVRAEAIAVIGRRRLTGEREILETIVRKESHVTVRQRAIVSLARTAGAQSLPVLRDVLESDAQEGVRASAVLALTLIGADALPALETVAQNDKSEEIRNRAQRAIENIRFALENQQRNRLRVGGK
jgi:hypothetical protein